MDQQKIAQIYSTIITIGNTIYWFFYNKGLLILSPSRCPKTENPSFWESKLMLSEKLMNYLEIELLRNPKIFSIAILPIKFKLLGSWMISLFDYILNRHICVPI